MLCSYFSGQETFHTSKYVYSFCKFMNQSVQQSLYVKILKSSPHRLRPKQTFLQLCNIFPKIFITESTGSIQCALIQKLENRRVRAEARTILKKLILFNSHHSLKQKQICPQVQTLINQSGQLSLYQRILKSIPHRSPNKRFFNSVTFFHKSLSRRALGLFSSLRFRSWKIGGQGGSADNINARHKSAAAYFSHTGRAANTTN